MQLFARYLAVIRKIASTVLARERHPVVEACEGAANLLTECTAAAPGQACKKMHLSSGLFQAPAL